MNRRLPLVVGLFFAASATAPAGADTPTIPPDYLCKPQQTATLSAGAQTATTPLDYLCKPQPATAPSGADTATIPLDYLRKPQQTAPGGAETATTPLDYLCKPQPATVSAPGEEQNAENARPADVTPHPEDNPTQAAAPAAPPAPPQKDPVGEPLPTVEDLPQYKFARSVQESPVAGGSAESRYLTTVYGMIKSHLHESPDLGLELANRHGIVDFYLDKGGTLVGRRLVSSSGSPNLDLAAMAAIAAAAPYPAPPNRHRSFNYNFGKSAQLNTNTSASAAPATIVPSVSPPAVGQPATVPASAETATAPGTPTLRFSEVGVADNTLIIGHFASTNPDCTSSGKTFVRISRRPSHGVITMREGLGFTNRKNATVQFN